MQELDKKYQTVLDNIKTSIQLSEELKVYLDTEEDEDYKALVQAHEGSIHELYIQVANENPLQLIDFEKYLLKEEFEGLYMPKALGYAVLRGRVNENIKYHRPQDHFAMILEFILASSNFEQIKKRVGQSIQIGFALSSDIWITNILATITNKRAKTFLESQRIDDYRDPKIRNTGLVKYRKQFQSLNFATANFPTNQTELLVEVGTLKDFLIYRGLSEYQNENLQPELLKFLSNKDLYNAEEFYELCYIIGMHFDNNDDTKAALKTAITEIRQTKDKASVNFFKLLNNHYNKVKGVDSEAEKKFSESIDKTIDDKVSTYFRMLDIVNTKGYVDPEASNAIREYYYLNEGLSDENEAVRISIRTKLTKFVSNLSITEYTEYFEINKVFSEYMEIFSNQKFNQDLKDVSLKYVQKCLKAYKDKRSKEYQDIKKFVKSTFSDYGFMTDKQLVELFKTKRKPKV